MNLYAVDDLMRHPDDAPTIGLLLCKGKDRMVVELRDLAKPLGVADWETRLVDILPDDLKGSLPTIEEEQNSMDIRIESVEQLFTVPSNNRSPPMPLIETEGTQEG